MEHILVKVEMYINYRLMAILIIWTSWESTSKTEDKGSLLNASKHQFATNFYEPIKGQKSNCCFEHVN